MSVLTGRPVADWVPVITHLKRDGDPEQALDIALASINALLMRSGCSRTKSRFSSTR